MDITLGSMLVFIMVKKNKPLFFMLVFFCILTLKPNITFATRYFAGCRTSVPGIYLYKFHVAGGTIEGGIGSSGFLSVDHSKKTPKDTHEILSDSLGTSGDIFKWTINSIGDTSYITMLPTEKIDGDESLLLNAAFLKVAFSGKNELKNDMYHTNSSLEFINDPKDTDRAQSLDVNYEITLENYNVAVLTRKEPTPDFYDRMTSSAFDDDDEKDIIINSDKDIYERIIARKKKIPSVKSPSLCC